MQQRSSGGSSSSTAGLLALDHLKQPDNAEDITGKLNLTSEAQREAYEAMVAFFARPENKPNKFGLVKVTSPGGVTAWVKDDAGVVGSFVKSDGKRVGKKRGV